MDAPIYLPEARELALIFAPGGNVEPHHYLIAKRALAAARRQAERLTSRPQLIDPHKTAKAS